MKNKTIFFLLSISILVFLLIFVYMGYVETKNINNKLKKEYSMLHNKLTNIHFKYALTSINLMHVNPKYLQDSLYVTASVYFSEVASSSESSFVYIDRNSLCKLWGQDSKKKFLQGIKKNTDKKTFYTNAIKGLDIINTLCLSFQKKIKKVKEK